MKKPRAIVSVINDLATDQRVERSCSLLHEMGYEVLLIGRKLKNSPPLPQRPYAMKRMRLWFEKGAAFYAHYNLRLFFILLFKKADLLVSNDLDTLLPNYLIAKLKNIPLVYDSHEYFTGVPELEQRPRIQAVWRNIERRIFPHLKHIITVNHSIAALYEKEYGKNLKVVRNVPRKRNTAIESSRASLGLPEDKTILILQGSGINVDRGAEEVLEAMRLLDEALLLIIGSGDVLPTLKAIASADAELSARVRFIPRIPYKALLQYTAAADIGLSLDKGNNLNYLYSLPNKLFDYIQCQTPVLASKLPEVAGIVEEYDVGITLDEPRPESIARAVREMVSDRKRMEKWQENCKIAAQSLCWENEREVLREVYASAARESHSSDRL